MTSRATRSSTRRSDKSEAVDFTASPARKTQPIRLKRTIEIEPVAILRKLTAASTNLAYETLTLLRDKQLRLLKRDGQVPTFIRRQLQLGEVADCALAQAAAATLVFAQEEAGTAICISSSGLLLTCSHCLAEDEASLDRDAPHWLLFACGQVVKTKCVAWDGMRDLALLQVTAATEPAVTSAWGQCRPPLGFPFVRVSESRPCRNTPLLCIGHPGSEDLESSQLGVETGYDVLHISTGKFCGMAKNQDAQDNSDIGALMHNCWTYWGHSGAPLLTESNGELTGLHSSWDEETGMRRGVGWEAIKSFLNTWVEIGD